jgi:hypothetical protein
VFRGHRHTFFTAPCDFVEIWCPYLSAGGLSFQQNAMNVTLTVEARTNKPVSLQTTDGTTTTTLSFDKFSTTVSTFQKDAGIFRLPFDFYVQGAPRVTPVLQTIDFLRSYTNDSYATILLNDNAATPAGEADWICSGISQDLIFSNFRVTFDVANMVGYSLVSTRQRRALASLFSLTVLQCNKGMCDCGLLCQGVGNETNGLPDNQWFSFPASAYCAPGFAVGTNNCSISAFKITASVTAACVLTISDPAFPSGFSPDCSEFEDTANHLLFSLKNCPDVTSTLPPPPYFY